MKNATRLLLVTGLMLVGAAAAFGQGEARVQVDPSYEVSLQFVLATNEGGGKSELPANLSPVARELKKNFAFSNYRVAGTLLGRVSNAGNYEYKSVSNIFGQESTADSPTFVEWLLTGFRGMPTAKGGPGFQGQQFRFGARVPVRTSSVKDENGKMSPVINYESIGVTLNRFGLAENLPTLIGTVSLPGTTGTIFLVMTAKPVD